MTEMYDWKEISDPNCVKVIVDKENFAKNIYLRNGYECYEINDSALTLKKTIKR